MRRLTLSRQAAGRWRPRVTAAGAELLDALFPGRFRATAWLLAAYLALSLATRIGLALFNADPAAFAPHRLAGWLSIGFLFDLVVGLWIALPLALLAWLVPAGRIGRRVNPALTLLLTFALLGALSFVAVCEFVFWHEFGVRFNFIAVDYLVYTREVVDNVRQSYPLPLLLAAVAALALLAFAAIARRLARAASTPGPGLSARIRAFGLLALLPLAGTASLDSGLREFSANASSTQLAGNGIWEFLHAFRTNEIDYAQFYRTLPANELAATLRRELAGAGPAPTIRAVGADGEALPLAREIVGGGAQQRLNVVLISVESLSADFMGSFGNPAGLTPNLDALARDGMLFTRMYATGIRTVRGLEAITLSLPPTPGHSVVARPDNGNLFTIGSVFAERGYEPIYLYGGYSHFDNMRTFFGGNGYTVVDRGALARGEITFENVWGVADEDLFRLTLREIDARHARGQPFYAHVMTTSNHRPYSFPADRIDLAPGSREAAVKYTDWAIGRFIAQARTRPWFDDTLFVIVADHCASSRGKTDLPIERFHIPLILYAPKHVAPRKVETLASQIDVAPTVLAQLHIGYRSRFFGHDILTSDPRHGRALLANYQTVGYLKDGVLVELRPKGRVRVLDAASGRALPDDARVRALTAEAIAYYQGAASAWRSGALRRASPTVAASVVGAADGTLH